jgi:hypothetical protein
VQNISLLIPLLFNPYAARLRNRAMSNAVQQQNVFPQTAITLSYASYLNQEENCNSEGTPSKNRNNCWHEELKTGKMTLGKSVTFTATKGEDNAY